MPLGSVHQDWSICTPQYSIKNGAGDTVLKIGGPFLAFSCCGDVVFDVLTRDKTTKVGKITKQWSGLAREMFTDADTFGVTFPIDLDVQVKAVLLATTFLIVSILFNIYDFSLTNAFLFQDFMFFESTDSKFFNCSN